jgi:hypothetical protein
MKRMRTFHYGLAILISIGIAVGLQVWVKFHRKPTFVAWMGQYYRPGAQDTSAAMDRLRALPPPNWSWRYVGGKTPVVILTEKGAYINGAADPVPFDAVISSLANLPDDEWPSGRVVSFYPSHPGKSGPGQGPPPAGVAQKVAEDLKSAGIVCSPGISD